MQQLQHGDQTALRYASSAAALVVAMTVTLAGMATVQAQSVLKSGSFRGAGGHKSSGQVRIVKSGSVRKVVFVSNFRLNGTPDPRVAFGKSRYVRGTTFAKLRRLHGTQEYVIPAGVNLAKYSQVWLWCKKFNAPLAVANVR